MKKTYKLDGLECANCAMKMEENIAKIDGVKDIKINFMMQKMIIEADDSKFDEIINMAQSIMHKYESECNIIK